jgi:hypothetical protein
MYEGYLLYPYRASAAKNRLRWQFGVLGPHGAVAAGVGEAPDLSTEILVRRAAASTVTIRLRFLHLQSRKPELFDAATGFVDIDELKIDDQRWLAWDEAIEQEVFVATVPVGDHEFDGRFPVSVEGEAGDPTTLTDDTGQVAGRLVRSRRSLSARVQVRVRTLEDDHDMVRLHVRVENLATLAVPSRSEALGLSFLSAHLLLTCQSGEFVSLIDPPPELRSVAHECRQHRCWPVLAGPEGNTDVLLVSPISLEDHPSLATESAGALFDSTEIDEILTLRILTMTEDEKSQARATDPRAAEIIDRSESLSVQEMARLHGARRDPRALDDPMSTLDSPDSPPVMLPAQTAPTFSTFSDATTDATTEVKTEVKTDVPWWDQERDASVDPSTDMVVVAGRAVRRGSLVRLHPNRRADAQDLFFADLVARVAGVHFDVDGATHVGVVLVDDPAADLHDWYGRYLYFDPDEIEPIEASPVEPVEKIETRTPTAQRKEG